MEGNLMKNPRWINEIPKPIPINEKIEIFRKYYCYLKNIMVQYYKSIKKNKKSRKE